MSQNRPNRHEPQSSFIRQQHRRALSRATNASGIAESSISYASTTATTGSDRIAQFPPPPILIPMTPTSTHGLSHPASLRSYPQSPDSTAGRSVSRGVPSGPRALPVLRKKVFTGQTASLSSGEDVPPASRPVVTGPRASGHSSTASRSQPRQLVEASVSSLSPTSPTHTYPSTSAFSPTQRDPSSGLSQNSSSPYVSGSSAVLSPYDWHEGSSVIAVDADEDRLLSTAFITSLLSSTGDRSSDASFEALLDTRSVGHGPARFSNHRSSNADTLSNISEMTYPPSSSRSPRDSSNNRGIHTDNVGLPRRSPLGSPRPAEQRLAPLLPVPNSQHQSRASAISGDSDTLYSHVGSTAPLVGGPVFRHPSTRQGTFVEGATSFFRKISGASGSSRSLVRKENDPFMNEKIVGESSSQGYLRESEEPKSGANGNTGSSPYGSHSPSTSSRPGHTDRQRHQSIQSTKSSKSYVSSLISRLTNHTSGTRSALSWLRTPLPPVPPLPGTSFSGRSKKTEESMPLPDLANRADILSQMLEKGRIPGESHVTLSSTRALVNGIELKESPARGLDEGVLRSTGIDPDGMGGFQYPREAPQPVENYEDAMSSPSKNRRFIRKLQRWQKIVVAVVVILLCAAVGIGVGVGVTRNNKNIYHCSGNFTGAACSLDATCACTSSSSECNPVAQSLLSLLPTVNSQFNTNLTTTDLTTALFLAQGLHTGSSCTAQALLVDVAPALNSNTFPNRTAWAQSALLWNLIQSADLSAISSMRSFVQKAKWKSLGAADGPLLNASSSFAVDASGYSFNFAAQTVTQQIQNGTFQSAGEPSGFELGEVDSTAQSALDRMYEYAIASSTQRQTALAKYWQSVLNQDPADLSIFMSTISASPIMIPFDATSSPGGTSIATLLNSTNLTFFPPPLACYPDLNASQIDLLDVVETQVFGLSTATYPSTFNPSCTPDRPIYGVLDVLQLRLPFYDSRANVAKQAAVLANDVAPRVVVYSGDILSTLPDATGPTLLTDMQTDPRQYGTLNNLNHVLFNFLTSIPDVNVAISFVEFILTQPAVPTANTSDLLFQSLAMIPVLEVALFGTLSPSDISEIVTSFTTPSGDLFFGSDDGEALRNWALTALSSSIAWTENSTSSEVVRDISLSDSAFLEVWDPVAEFLDLQPLDVIVGVSNITAAFQTLGKFSP